MIGNPKTPAIPNRIPTLEAGDRLSRVEFERRYAAMPGVKKAELIEGIVFMPSPVRFERHGSPHAALISWFWHYCSQTPGVRTADNASVRLDMDNEPQPDALLVRMPSYGGRVSISDDDYLEGAPDLVAEVAASSVSIDLHTKLQIYRRNQVQEYIVWRVEEGEIDWFVLHEGIYVKRTPNAGVFLSDAFPGLWLDTDAMVSGDSSRILKVLEEGLSSPEHAAFVRKLQEAKLAFETPGDA
jgi:Uma2 family endonuclease